MLEKTENDTVARLLVDNIEIIEFENRITEVFKDNLLEVESIIRNHIS